MPNARHSNLLSHQGRRGSGHQYVTPKAPSHEINASANQKVHAWIRSTSIMPQQLPLSHEELSGMVSKLRTPKDSSPGKAGGDVDYEVLDDEALRAALNSPKSKLAEFTELGWLFGPAPSDNGNGRPQVQTWIERPVGEQRGDPLLSGVQIWFEEAFETVTATMNAGKSS